MGPPSMVPPSLSGPPADYHPQLATLCLWATRGRMHTPFSAESQSKCDKGHEQIRTAPKVWETWAARSGGQIWNLSDGAE